MKNIITLLLFFSPIQILAQENNEYYLYNNKKYKISDIKVKCEIPKYSSYKICQDIKKNDLPIEKKSEKIPEIYKSRVFSFSVDFALLGDIKGYSGLIDYNIMPSLAIGGFYQNKKMNKDGVMLNGNIIGGGIKYYFLSNKKEQLITPSISLLGGFSNFTSDYGEIPKYLYWGISTQVNLKIKKYDNYDMSTYLKIENSEIYHSTSGSLHLGSSINLGLSIDF